ncbi:MAG: hypothetical protein WAU12_06240 [Saprospiraceae bacterium]|jgi:membrane protein CcdC involved in cytochrome C biogenesis|nr:hypothetical protein [Candidatus Brachybacter algidus]MBK8749990.1 hypothetical protein [Candidatus Brachybacter algidus]MBK9022771.1 hypothetical protein [Candidatus Brachybacter algidus]
MKNKAIIVTAILLVISLGNFFRIYPALDIRNVDMLSIFIIGFLAGILVILLYNNSKK